METVKQWISTSLVVIGILILCGWLDEPPAPTSCVAEIRDQNGNMHIISGQIAQVSVQ